MARASMPTLLPLDTWAKIMGVAPPHFGGATGETVFLAGRACSDTWPQYSWQNHDQVSREDLAIEIHNVEQDIARIVGYFPAPHWIAQEVRNYPRHHRRDVYSRGGLNVRAQRKSVALKFGKFIQAGRRNVATVVGTATVAGLTLVYSDDDGDGYDETVTITLATALTNACEIKAYFVGHSGAREWEIRPPRSVTISGGNVVLVFDAWLLLDPDLWEQYPGTAINTFGTIDLEASASYVTSVEIRREFNDFTQASATFFWEPKPIHTGGVLSSCATCSGSGCPACSLTSQDGCLHVRDTEMGIVVPQPATYDSDEGVWDQDAYTVCRDPDFVRMYYCAGELGNRWLDDSSCMQISDFWAQTITWIATARLERPFCSCGNVQALSDKLRVDLALTGEKSFLVDPDELKNPLGTRRGEIMAWRRINRVIGMQIKGGVI